MICSVSHMALHLLRTPVARSNFLKAYEYVNRVKQFKTQEVMAQVRADLERQPIMEFEATQLGNLCPEDADEAKALVPSLGLPNMDGQPRDIDSAQLTEVLQQICDSRQFD
mmetsp:Transcript_30100/g.92164  ORF Transcript_30100/g.92164 Transcript_30100/m.92164 type:complete len:111 (-) Transcript_30100:153-485(-)